MKSISLILGRSPRRNGRLLSGIRLKRSDFLLPDAELAEDLAEEVVGGDFAEDGAEG